MNTARPAGPEGRSEHEVVRHQGAVGADEDLEIRPAVAVGVAGQDAACESQLARDIVEGLGADEGEGLVAESPQPGVGVDRGRSILSPSTWMKSVTKSQPTPAADSDAAVKRNVSAPPPVISSVPAPPTRMSSPILPLRMSPASRGTLQTRVSLCRRVPEAVHG